jgi:hypothetical protein
MAFVRVIPGHRAAMNPEPMHTDLEKHVPTPASTWDTTVFMGSGFGPAGRPGMTKVISGQTLRGANRRVSAPASAKAAGCN